MARLDYQRLELELEYVDLTAGQVLHQAGDALVSLLTLADRDSTLAVGLAGNEGLVGVTAALGVNTSPMRALVQVPGSALPKQTAILSGSFRKTRSCAKPCWAMSTH